MLLTFDVPMTAEARRYTEMLYKVLYRLNVWREFKKSFFNNYE